MKVQYYNITLLLKKYILILLFLYTRTVIIEKKTKQKHKLIKREATDFTVRALKTTKIVYCESIKK